MFVGLRFNVLFYVSDVLIFFIMYCSFVVVRFMWVSVFIMLVVFVGDVMVCDEVLGNSSFVVV